MPEESIFFLSSSTRSSRRGQFFLDGLDLFVEVVLFLRLLHLPLHARLDGAVHVSFSISMSSTSAMRERRSIGSKMSSSSCFSSIESCRLAQWCRSASPDFHLHRGDHGLVVERLAEFDVLFEQPGDALHGSFDRWSGFGSVLRGADHGLEEAVGCR